MKIKFSKKHIKEFKKMGIQTIYLFGSRAKGRVTPLSDVDIGVVFERPEKYEGRTLAVYNKLYKIFTEVLPKKYLKQRFKLKEHEFDIVFLQFAPISLQFDATKNKKVLYEKNKEKRFQYEEYISRKYCDLQYFYNIHYNAILERI